MPWNLDGTFTRENGLDPQFKGQEVWQDDQKAGIKVIASRHDFHDEDLAQGIEACLNLDGLNAMRADLDLGGFKIINAGDGGGEDEVSDGIYLPTLPTGFTLGPKHGGSWVRQGRLVQVFGYIDYSTNPQTNVPFIIGNLPFTIAAPNGGDPRQYQGSFAGWDNVDLSGVNPPGGLGVDGSPQLFTRQLAAPTTGADGRNVAIWRYIGANNPDAGIANELVELENDFLTVSAEFSFNWSYLTNDAPV
jgi:hypothetical protein